MVSSLWLLMATSFLCTKLRGATCASHLIACHRRFTNISQGFDWFFHLLHLSEGDTPC